MTGIKEIDQMNQHAEMKYLYIDYLTRRLFTAIRP
jgi:hypothetical protein